MQEQEFLKHVRERAGLKDNDEAKHDTEVVFQTLRGRISHEGAENIGAQLPKELKELWDVGWWERIKREITGTEHLDLGAFIAKVAHELKTEDLGWAENVVRAVFTTLQEQITEGAAGSIESQLPEDLRDFWRECAPGEEAAAVQGPPFEFEAPVETGVTAGPTEEEEVGARPWGPETDVPSGADIESTSAADEERAVCEVCGMVIGAGESHEHTWEEVEGVEPPAVERVQKLPPAPAKPEEGPGCPSHYRSDFELEQEVKQLLDSAEVDTSRINVFVRAGNVTLRGTVRSEDERETAGLAAARALAVGEILNEITVE